MFTARRVWIGGALAVVALLLASGLSEVSAQIVFRGLPADGPHYGSRIPVFVKAGVPPGLQNVTGMPGNSINTGNAFTFGGGGGKPGFNGGFGQ